MFLFSAPTRQAGNLFVFLVGVEGGRRRLNWGEIIFLLGGEEVKFVEGPFIYPP